MMISAAVPSPSRPSTRPRLGAIVAVGVAFALLQTCLIATFPLLEGTELRSRVQSAVVSALDFPLGFAQPVFAAVAGSSGGTAFLVGVGLTFLNGALWAAVAIAVLRRMRLRG
jgi:ribosomal protein S12 methylthiotransferase accessory factor YcaO